MTTISPFRHVAGDKNIMERDGIHRIHTLHSLEKDLVQANSSDGEFVNASISTSEVNVNKLYFKTFAVEYIH